MLRSVLVASLVVVALASRAVAQSCPADCDGNASVAVNELITCVGIALAEGATTACPACDGDADGAVAINELIAGVGSALGGCGAGAMADLVPVAVQFSSSTPSCITDTREIEIQLVVCVENRGAAASGPFDVEVLGEPFGRAPALAAGAQQCVVGPFVPFSIDVQVDASGEVAERDESNNFATFFVPQPTPPPFCAATATPDHGATPTATDGGAGEPSATPTATPLLLTPTPAG